VKHRPLVSTEIYCSTHKELTRKLLLVLLTSQPQQNIIEGFLLLLSEKICPFSFRLIAYGSTLLALQNKRNTNTQGAASSDSPSSETVRAAITVSYDTGTDEWSD
jgi:hypothetical protein